MIEERDDELKMGEVRCLLCRRIFGSMDEAFDHWEASHPDDDEFRVGRIMNLVTTTPGWTGKLTFS